MKSTLNVFPPGGVFYLVPRDHRLDFMSAYVCCVCVLFTLTDRVSTIPRNIRGCQSGTWYAGQEMIVAVYLTLADPLRTQPW